MTRKILCKNLTFLLVFTSLISCAYKPILDQNEQYNFNRKLGYFINTTKTVDLREVSWHLSLATDCYHGGRNEQFWFGPAFEDDWIDYDLAGAYPTAMALIAEPDWKNIRITQNGDDFTPLTNGVAHVEFEFLTP